MLKTEAQYLVRISKSAARDLYEHGEEIYLCACKMDPDWSAILYSKQLENATFGEIVNGFTGMFCSARRGTYPAYYVKKTWGGKQK